MPRAIKVAKKGRIAVRSDFDRLDFGDEIRLCYGNLQDKLLHVRGRIDGMLVVRSWSKRRHRWIYMVEDDIWWHVITRPGQDSVWLVEHSRPSD